MSSSSEPSTEARARYRTSPSSEEHLAVAVVDRRGGEIPARIIDLSAGGIGLFFTGQSGPEFAVDETVYLRMTSSYLQRTVVVPTHVRRTQKVDWGSMYGFEFVDWMGLLSQIPEALAALFNRRQDWRIELDTGVQVHIRIPQESSSSVTLYAEVEGVLCDVSVKGLSFRVEPEAEALISSSQFVAVSFALPETPEPFAFGARVLYDDAGCRGCFGVVFEEEETEHWREMQERLAARLKELREELRAFLVTSCAG